MLAARVAFSMTLWVGGYGLEYGHSILCNMLLILLSTRVQTKTQKEDRLKYDLPINSTMFFFKRSFEF